MEQIIFLIIMAIVSSLFGKLKNNKEQKQMPPFNKKAESHEPKPERPPVKMQSFEDFAREFLGDKKVENPKKEVQEEHVKSIKEKAMEPMPSYVAPPLIPTEPYSRSTERASVSLLAASKKDVQVSSSNKAFQLPSSKKSLMQAVIMAEVLGPPKAKRK